MPELCTLFLQQSKSEEKIEFIRHMQILNSISLKNLEKAGLEGRLNGLLAVEKYMNIFFFPITVLKPEELVIPHSSTTAST